MKKIYLFEETSCHAPTGAHLVERLQRWYKSSAEVRVYDLAAPEELVPLPPELFFRLQDEGPACLPALVVDGKVVAQRKLPPFGQAVELIEAAAVAAVPAMAGAPAAPARSSAVAPVPVSGPGAQPSSSSSCCGPSAGGGGGCC